MRRKRTCQNEVHTPLPFPARRDPASQPVLKIRIGWIPINGILSITPFEIKKYPLPSLNALSTFTGSEQRKDKRHIRHYQLYEPFFSEFVAEETTAIKYCF